MDILPAIVDLMPDASFFKGCGAVLTITRSALYQSYIGDYGSIVQHSYMRSSATRLAFAWGRTTKVSFLEVQTSSLPSDPFRYGDSERGDSDDRD